MERKKIAVIGSGMAGLTAGAYLARDGHNVTVYEQFAEPGGVTATLSRDGFSWDLGPLLLEGFGPREMGDKILRELGIEDRLAAGPYDRGIVFPDFSLWRPEEYRGALWRRMALKEVFPHDGPGLDRYYRLYRNMYRLITLSRRQEFEERKPTLFEKIRMAADFLPIRRYESLSAADLMEELFTSPCLRAVFTGILADLMVKPSEFPALGVPLFNLESAFDARNPDKGESPGPRSMYHYIAGGCGSLVKAVQGSLEGAGGVLRTSSTVSKIETRSGRVSGVRVNGDLLPADLVLSTAGARETFYDLLGREMLPGEYTRVIDGQIEMESVFMVHLGVDFKPKQRGALCYYYGTCDIEKGVDDIRKGRYHEGHDGFVLYIPSFHSPSMAPENCHAVTIYTVAPNEISGTSWESCSSQMADMLIAEAEKYVPGLQAGTVVREIMTPADFRKRTGQKHHSFGGVAPVIGRENPTHRTPVAGLWYLGSQSESKGGVMGVMKGGRTVARTIRDELARS